MEVLSTINAMKAKIDALKEQVNIGVIETVRNVVVTRNAKIEDPKPLVFKGVRDAQEVEKFLWYLDNYFQHENVRKDDAKINIAVLYILRHLKAYVEIVLVSGVFLYLASILLFKDPNCSSSELLHYSTPQFGHDSSPTNLSHLLFGLLGSEEAWHFRKEYIESWWRPNKTRGYLFLDVAPTGDDLLPWSSFSPPYRVSDNITQLIEETKHVAPTMARMVHGIIEVFREEHEGVRWVVMGDDDSIFFVDNMVDVLSRYDHTKYYYLGGQSEFLMSNHWYSFNQAFGGAGFILSYPLAKAMSKYIESCLRRYPFLRSADQITMVCISDVGVILTPLKGSHQIDLRGDISGLLSSHPKALLMSLHHLDAVDSIFPSIERQQSVRHLMKVANLDQSRMLQQVICYNRPSNWSFSISWGYSVHIYENILPRSHLQLPIETFQPWGVTPKDPPYYMLNTRSPTNDSCEAPHVFFMKNVETTKKNEILTTYSRSSPRELLACSYSGNHSANYIFKIEVYSPRRKRIEMDRCECCDVMHEKGTNKAKVKLRECHVDEIIA